MSLVLQRSTLIGILVTLLAACSAPGTASPAPLTGNPYAPLTGDGSLVRDNVRITSVQILSMESNPVQYSLQLAFFLPTPCHQFRIKLGPPDGNKRIDVAVYSLMKPNHACALMATRNPIEASLVLGSLPKGHYAIWVNGVKQAEFDA